MFDFHKLLRQKLAWGARRPSQTDPALLALFDEGAAGIAELDLASGRFVRLNRRFAELLRRDAAWLLASGPGDLIHPEDRAAVLDDMAKAIRAGGRWEAEVRHLDTDGGLFWLRIGCSVWRRNADGAPIGAVAVVQDVSESVANRERLRHSEELLRLGQQIGRIGSFSRDLKTGVLNCDSYTSRMFGLPTGEAAQSRQQWFGGIAPEDRRRVQETIEAALTRRDEEVDFECRITLPEGVVRYLEVRARYYYDDDATPLRSVGVVIDVTERKNAEDRLAYAAQHDPLTGLGNRALYQARVADAADRLARLGQGFALLCLDLDRFKDVNDTLGHPKGDRLLIGVAARLRENLRAGDTLARLGGDEFAVIQTSLAHPDDAGRLAERLVAAIAEPFALDGESIVIGASIGVAVAPRDGVESEALLSAADLALYQAKSRAMRGWRYFEPEMNVQAVQRREFERDMRTGLEQGHFELFYQPVIQVASLKVERFEALLRWRHPERGLIPPDDFIPLAEENGFIAPLGAWVLQQACRDAVTWPATIGVAVNISAVQIGVGDLDRIVMQALADSGLAAERLELEVTETALLNDSETTLARLRKLKAIGVRIVMDDFGAGHSSLGYLQSFPFDTVKIDRSFAAGVDQLLKNAAIVKAIIDLCAALGMTATIEGVETEGQFRALKRMGGQKVQGFLFSPPRPAHCVAGLIAQFGGNARTAQAAE